MSVCGKKRARFVVVLEKQRAGEQHLDCEAEKCCGIFFQGKLLFGKSVPGYWRKSLRITVQRRHWKER